MTQWWDLWPRTFTPAECVQIREYALRIPSAAATVGAGAQNRIDPKRRTAEIRWLNRQDVNLRWLFERLTYLFKASNDKICAFDITDFRETQYSIYKAEDQGHYDWHFDTFWKNEKQLLSQRKLSLVMQISDASEYEGGKLEFEFDNLKGDQFANQGDVVVFPSVLRHRAAPVTKGVRHSLVTWCYGPNFR